LEWGAGSYALSVIVFGGLRGPLRFGLWRLRAYRCQIRIAVKSADNRPVEPKVNDPGRVLACGADFQPVAIPPAFPFQGESGVRRCFAVGHENGLPRLQMREKMIRLHTMVVIVKLAVAGRIEVKRIQPVERFRNERDGGKGRCGYCLAAARDLSGCKAEPSPRFLRASAMLCRLRGWSVARQRLRKLPELSPERFGETGGLPVGWRETLVFASGFPIPEAPIVLARLRRAVAVVQLPVRSPAAVAGKQPRQCISRSRLCFPLRPRGDTVAFHPRGSARV